MLTIFIVADYSGMVSTGSLPLEPGQSVDSILSAARSCDVREGG